MIKCTLKTIRKNGRKWSNISVKKYHHNPVVGVKSGSVIVAPHVWETHPQFPQIRVDASVKVAKYIPNSPKSGISLLILLCIALGEARLDTGLPINRSRIGNSITIEDKDRCVRNDKTNIEADAFFRQANMIAKSIRVFSSEDDDSAREGRKI